ncbi:HAD family hydrolase [Rugamonas sp. CCM 8940]|uniref:HAD family hydrolase n=1 Tax=Rugamonas sp. CCM 8940 TaxID=2765359 RepID=UPI0018F64D08|nr:HAD family hydrolase [Rugamonas sp. CCM 8940]MBJ7311563.1 HAD family hydrolase [Rugamonas sp. CCM 8940]
MSTAAPPPSPSPSTSPSTSTSSRPQAVLFDLDDTLWPIGPVIARAELTLHAWLGQHAPKVAQRFSIEQLREYRMALLRSRPELAIDLSAVRRAGLLAAFAEAGEDSVHVEAAMRHFLAARNAVVLYEDVLPGLLRLKQKLRLGTISNGNGDLAAIGLDQHFEVSLAACHVGHGKPDPAIFLAACAALGVAPRHAVYVGDDLQLDVVGAQRAGLRAVWLNRHGGDAHLAAGVVPDAICASFDEVRRWIERQLEE